MRVKVKSKDIPVSFLKVEGRRTLVGAIDRRERKGQIEELVSDQNPGPKAPPRSKKGQEKREQRRFQERSDGEGWVCHSREGKEVRGDDPIEYFLPAGVGSTS